jgi:hypothetical protein
MPVFLNPAWWSTRLKARVMDFDRVNPNFFINQNDVVLVKKINSQRVVTGFLTWSCWVNPPSQPSFWLPLFFDKLSPVPTPSQSGPGLTHYTGLGFKTMIYAIHFFHQNLLPHWSFEIWTCILISKMIWWHFLHFICRMIYKSSNFFNEVTKF